MSDDLKHKRSNDSLQGGEGKDAYGEDAREFGAGGQRDSRAFDSGHDDRRDRDPGRDPTAQRPEQAEPGRTQSEPAESER